MRMTPFVGLAAAFCTCFAQMPDAPSAGRPTPQFDPDGRPFHVVKSGENLLDIAATYRLTLKRLRELNPLPESNLITEGQHLYLAPKGAKVAFEGGGQGAAPAAPKSSPAEMAPPPEEVPPQEDIPMASAPRDPQGGQVAGPLLSTAKAFRRGAVSRTGGQAGPVGTAINPEAGKAQPANTGHTRPLLPQGTLPLGPMVDAVAPLPLLDGGRPRAQWTDSQKAIAASIERRPVHTVGILTSAKWLADQEGARLVLTLAPTGRTAASIQVSIPGIHLPSTIDLTQIRRWNASRVAVEVVGHFQYLEGEETLRSISEGTLLSPWGILAQEVRVHVPAGPWTPLTVPPADPTPEAPKSVQPAMNNPN